MPPTSPDADAGVVVIGGGFGSLAVAARLAKAGHFVRLVEAADRLGGCLDRIEQDEFGWDAGPSHTLLPAVIRDLFRKSGRPLERELPLEHRELVAEHRFRDGSRLALPGSSREAQHDAVEAWAPGRGAAWCAYVADYASTWEVLRKEYLERPWDPSIADREVSAVLFGRESLHRRTRRALPDRRLRLLARQSMVDQGHDPRLTPAWTGVTAYLEQRFGVWRVPPSEGGMAALADVLTARLRTRGVQVHTGLRAEDVVVRNGAVTAVRTADGDLSASAVVCGIDPRRLPTMAPLVERMMPTIPAPVAYLGLASGGMPELVADRTVLHTKEGTITVTRGGIAPADHEAWTVHSRGPRAADVLDALSVAGLDVRKSVVRRVELSPRDQVERWGGSPWGVLWQGRGTMRARLGPRTPIEGLYAVGAHAAPGAGLPWVGLSAALVAEAIGRA